MPQEMSATLAIKRYFESDPHGRKVEMAELTALKQAGPDAYRELGQMAADALGATLKPAAA